MSIRIVAVLALWLFSAACQSGSAANDLAAGIPIRPEIEVSRPPYAEVFVDFKQTFNEAYVYLDGPGDSAALGAHMAQLVRLVSDQGLEPVGPAFALWGSAGEVQRVGVPVVSSADAAPPLKPGQVGEQMVAYAVVEGNFGSASHAIPAIDTYLQERGWVPVGPRRELYARDAAGTRYLTEVQVPWANGR